MLIVRSVQPDDVDPLFDLIQQSELGLTTLKISKQKLQARIEQSVFAFRQEIAQPKGQPYVFVLEDLSNGRLVGTSAIYSKVGGFEPFYSYQIERSIHKSEELGVHKEIDVLHLHAEHNGPTEIGSLFLAPDYWGQGHGRLLSMSRFLFIANFPERFEKRVIAELRGVVDKDGKSPLWSALGSHFFQIDFPRAETLTSESKKFIADLMPQHPIYIPLLPEQAQRVIGQVHEYTRPALALLEKEGFALTEHVDIFDGGPTVCCNTDEIRAIRESCSAPVVEIAKSVDGGQSRLISNCKINFLCCLGSVRWTGDSDQRRQAGQQAGPESGAVINQVTALQLKLKTGDRLRAVEIKPKTPRRRETSTPTTIETVVNDD